MLRFSVLIRYLRILRSRYATGKRPFGDAAGPQLITAILEAQPSPPRSRNHHVSPALESVILKALDKNPNRRYQSARELRVDLERLSDGAVPRAQQSRRSWTAEETLALRKELGDENNIAWARTLLGAIALEQGRQRDAERLAREAADAFDRMKAAESGAVANAWLAAVLLEEGKAAEAQSTAERAISLSQRSASRVPRFEATLASARVLGATGETSEAVKKLDAMLTDTRKYGYLPYEYQARLALGRIEIQSGRREAGGARLAALEREARAKGFALIADKSAKAR